MSRVLHLLLILLATVGTYTLSWAADLPICSNSVINAVTKRAGCTVGDRNCWLTRGGFCMDYVEKRLRRDHGGQTPHLLPVNPAQLRSGDVAKFSSRVHYAYVESVIRNASGKPVAVNLAEYNYGTCMVDEESMVTDRYLLVNKRSGVAISSVDGGFLRPQPAK